MAAAPFSRIFVTKIPLSSGMCGMSYPPRMLNPRPSTKIRLGELMHSGEWERNCCDIIFVMRQLWYYEWQFTINQSGTSDFPRSDSHNLPGTGPLFMYLVFTLNYNWAYKHTMNTNRPTIKHFGYIYLVWRMSGSLISDKVRILSWHWILKVLSWRYVEVEWKCMKLVLDRGKW